MDNKKKETDKQVLLRLARRFKNKADRAREKHEYNSCAIFSMYKEDLKLIAKAL
jgi:hypothetical protein